MAANVLPTVTSIHYEQRDDKSLPTNWSRGTYSASERPNAADSTPCSYSRPTDAVTTTTTSEVQKPLSNNARASASVGLNGEDILIMVVVFMHDRIVKRAQLPFPHTSSHEIQNILNRLNHPDFKLTRAQKSFIATVDLMESQQGPSIDQLVARLPTNDELPSTLRSIAREVFLGDVPDGLLWGRLLAVFVFSGRVAVQCVKTEAGSYVSAIAIGLQKLILEDLHTEIARQGGWEAFLAYCNRGDQLLNASSLPSSKGSRLSRFFSQLATVADFGSQVEDPASPQPLTSTIGWIAAPLALGASALYGVFAGGKDY